MRPYAIVSPVWVKYGASDGDSATYRPPTRASNSNATFQSQVNPTAIFGGHIDDVHVANNQANETYQSADADGGLGGFRGFHGFGGADASNDNLTLQIQANPTVIVGDRIGDVDVTNNQVNGTHQSADADGGHGLPTFDLGHGLDFAHAFSA